MSKGIFFAGVGTTILFLGAGFGGGLMFAKTAMEPVPQNRVTAADRLPPARVILPPSAEAAPAPGQTAVPPAPAPQQQAQPQAISAKDVEVQSQSGEKEKADRADRVKAAERERRRRYAEREARRQAAHAKQLEQQGQEARRQQPGIVAFGDEQPRSGGFFGN